MLTPNMLFVYFNTDVEAYIAVCGEEQVVIVGAQDEGEAWAAAKCIDWDDVHAPLQ